MTCCAGVEHEGRVWLAGDSAATDDRTSIQSLRAEPKVWVAGEFVFGYASSFRFGELVKHVFKAPKLPRAGLERYMTRDFVPALRECFKVDMDLQDGDKHPDVELLIGVRGRLFEMYEDFQVGRPREGYSAIGSGAAVALGALHSVGSLPARNRLRAALAAAAAHNAYVRPPFAFVVTPEKPKGG